MKDRKIKSYLNDIANPDLCFYARKFSTLRQRRKEMLVLITLSYVCINIVPFRT